MRKSFGLDVIAALMLSTSLVFLSGCHGGAGATKPNDRFISLFDGKSLDGWKVGDNPESWKVVDGQIVVHGKGPSHLFYVGPVHNHDFKDFHLKAMVLTRPHANSGIYFDTKFQQAGFPDQGFEVQVNCTHTDWKKTGSLYDIINIRDPHQVDDKWFQYDIIVQGNHVVLKIDGVVVCDWTQPADFQPPKGHPGRFIQPGTFALQGHDPGSEVHFKDIMVKPLD